MPTTVRKTPNTTSHGNAAPAPVKANELELDGMGTSDVGEVEGLSLALFALVEALGQIVVVVVLGRVVVVTGGGVAVVVEVVVVPPGAVVVVVDEVVVVDDVEVVEVEEVDVVDDVEVVDVDDVEVVDGDVVAVVLHVTAGTVVGVVVAVLAGRVVVVVVAETGAVVVVVAWTTSGVTPQHVPVAAGAMVETEVVPAVYSYSTKTESAAGFPHRRPGSSPRRCWRWCRTRSSRCPPSPSTSAPSSR